MEYLSNNRGHKCLNNWYTHTLSFSQMSRKWIMENDFNFFLLIHCAI